MTVRKLYAFLNERIPTSLSCAWDNDGLMCCADADAKVKRVLVALDITAKVVKTAIDGGYDLIVSHHPLIFSPLRAIDPDDHVAKKVISLLRAGISAMSFHTRLDAVEGGVNDRLASLLGLEHIAPFGQDGEEIGRVGSLAAPMTLKEFAALVRTATGAEQLLVSDAGRTVSRVALLGGSGSDDVKAAIKAGADTYLTGELKHNYLTDAPELGINLVSAGHFHTEDPVCKRIKELLMEADASLAVDIVSSNTVTVM